MTDTVTLRHPIRFEPWYRALSTALGLPPRGAYVAATTDEVQVRMGWAFRCTFPRSAVASVSPSEVRPLSRGVHGFAGRWLVNGSGRGLVSIQLRPEQKARVLGLPVRLRELLVSVNDPSQLVTDLAGPRLRR
jgi:hypothetical protein